jgi:GAF domain-containing protein
MIGSRLVGVIASVHSDPSREFGSEDLRLLELFAPQAAIAIENARLYTEQVEARRKVEDLSRLKDEFLSIASHELRTPLAIIKGNIDLARQGEAKNAKSIKNIINK